MLKQLLRLSSCALFVFPLATHAAPEAVKYPIKPVTIVVSFPAGGTTDTITRIVGQRLSIKWGQPVIVENRPGAGGNIAGGYVSRAEPDGYTLFSSAPGPLAVNANLYKNLNFDPRKFTPITMIADMPNVLAVGPSVKARTVQELISYAKQHPGKVSYASQGNGTTSHLTGELFQSLTGTKLLHVPYKGSAPALTGLMGGEVDMIFDNITSSLPFYQRQRLDILAVTAPTHLPSIPKVPTIAQAGLPNFLSGTWVCVVAPPGTPAAIADKVSKDMAEVLKMAEVIKLFEALGAKPYGTTPAQTSVFLKEETDKWHKVIQSAAIVIE